MTIRLVHAKAPVEKGFDARLEGVTLADLIQMKCFSGLTEGCRITSGGRTGWLFFQGGALTHASAGALKGDQAVLELLGWSAGNCDPTADLAPEDARVQHAWQALLLTAAKAQDELNQPALPSKLGNEREPTASELTFTDGTMTHTINPKPNISAPTATVIRLDGTGRVLSATGDHEELIAATAYVLHVAGHIAEGLGLEPLRGCEFRTGDRRTLIQVEQKGDVIAIQSNRESDVTEARARIGL